MTYVKINMKDWCRELCAHLGEIADDRPAYIDLYEHYVEWCFRTYAERDVLPPADQARHFKDNAEFLSRAELENDEGEPVDDLDWENLCLQQGYYFWTKDYACVNDGFIDV